MHESVRQSEYFSFSQKQENESQKEEEEMRLVVDLKENVTINMHNGMVQKITILGYLTLSQESYQPGRETGLQLGEALLDRERVKVQLNRKRVKRGEGGELTLLMDDPRNQFNLLTYQLNPSALNHRLPMIVHTLVRYDQ